MSSLKHLIPAFLLCSITWANRCNSQSLPWDLKVLQQFEMTDQSTGNVRSHSYTGLNLRRDVSGDSLSYFIGKKRVFTWATDINEYLHEVFDSSYLLVTFIKRPPLGPASPDLYRRDSVFIADLVTGNCRWASLPNFFLTRSEEILKMYPDPENQESNSNPLLACIEKIDFSGNRMIILDRGGERHEIGLRHSR